jgi:PIN domain nuclease of toxin-antitoxin system
VRLLLDTNALLRWHAGQLGPEAVRAVQQAELVAVSAISAWEIAIKRSLGKLKLREGVEDLAAMYGLTPLVATLRHGDMLRELPRHHSDPLDRLLIVQALEEGLTILTSDRAFEPYRVAVVWA